MPSEGFLMYLKSLHLQNLLSFGPETSPITLGPLNVLIGPNGSGKSNLIEALGLLSATPRSISDFFRDSGGVGEWFWKGNKVPSPARVDAVIETRVEEHPTINYALALTQSLLGQQVALESIWGDPIAPDQSKRLYFQNHGGRQELLVGGQVHEVDRTEFNPSESILSQRRDPHAYPQLFYLSGFFERIRLYRDWRFGRYSPPRLPQPSDLPSHYLMPDGQNLGLILNQIRREPEAKEALLKHLRLIYEGIQDVDVGIIGGTVQVFLQEHRWVVPATRLSDGTLRWLLLLAILLNPLRQLVACIEEPELGLHPDLLPPLAGLLREASQRMQLIVTTHSDVLIDALSDTPESVIVCEKHEGSTTMRRLDKADLSEWLKKYSLGQLWRRGEIGGNRW
jgi:predicted ATPase